MRRVVAFTLSATGLAVLVFTFASSSFLRLGDGQVILDRFRGITTAKGFGAFHDDVAETAAAVTELRTTTSASFARDFGLTPAQFAAYTKANFSAVARGEQTVQQLPTLITPVADGVAALPGDKFESVYDLPVSGLPLTSVPWLLLGLGAALAAGGVVLLRLPARTAAALAVTAGLGLVVVPLAISLPAKVEQTARVIRIGDAGLSPQAATRSEQAAYDVDGLVRQLRDELLPAVAARRHVTTAQLTAQLGTRSPALSRFLGDWGAMAPRTFGFAATIRESVGQYAEAKQFPFEETPWLLIALGGLLVLVAGATTLPRTARAASPSTA